MAKIKKFCQKCKTYGGAHQTHNTNGRWDKDGKPLGQYGSKPSEKNKPYKKHGGEKGLAYMMSMLEAIQEGQKKLRKVISVRNARTIVIVIPIVNRNFGLVTRD